MHPINTYTVRVAKREPKSRRQPNRKLGVEAGSGFNISVQAINKKRAQTEARETYPNDTHLIGRVWAKQ